MTSHPLASTCPYCGSTDKACASISHNENIQARMDCRLKVEKSRKGKDPWE